MLTVSQQSGHDPPNEYPGYDTKPSDGEASFHSDPEW